MRLVQYSSANEKIPPKYFSLASRRFVAQNSSKSSRTGFSIFTTLSHLLTEIFLPVGYPNSVSADYLAYQLWDTIQALASSVVGTLATHAVLTGIGVGDEAATPLAATLTWLAKDGLGMVGRITFVWFQGSDLDNDLKRWRFFADVLNDLALGLELVSGLIPRNYVTPLLCASSAAKSIVGVSGGATRTALTQHQARFGNTADVSAKDSSQETLVNLIALILSLMVVPLVAENLTLTWLFYVFLTWLHLYANYRAVRALKLQTVNDKRMAIIFNVWNRGNDGIPSVNSVNNLEPILLATSEPFVCKIGVSLDEFLTCVDFEQYQFSKLCNMFRGRNYIIAANQTGRKPTRVLAILTADASAKDVIECSYLCRLLAKNLTNNGMAASTSEAVEFIATQTVRDEAGGFIKSLETASWIVDRHNLTLGPYRFELLDTPSDAKDV